MLSVEKEEGLSVLLKVYNDMVFTLKNNWDSVESNVFVPKLSFLKLKLISLIPDDYPTHLLRFFSVYEETCNSINSVLVSLVHHMKRGSAGRVQLKTAISLQFPWNLEPFSGFYCQCQGDGIFDRQLFLDTFNLLDCSIMVRGYM